jgi:hypothetical protein
VPKVWLTRTIAISLFVITGYSYRSGQRVYGRGQFVFDPKHYLALLEQKAGALDQAAPLQNWTLPEPLQHLRRLLEARTGNRGKREFIQALRLIEVFPETLVAAAALDAIRLGASSEGSNSELNGALSMNDLLEHLGLRFYGCRRPTASA